jgi:hypothetical protein
VVAPEDEIVTSNVRDDVHDELDAFAQNNLLHDAADDAEDDV